MNRNRELKNIFSILFYLNIFILFFTNFAFSADQVVSLESSNTAPSENEIITISVQYEATDDSKVQTVLGLRIHFDSSSLEYVGYNEKYFFSPFSLEPPVEADEGAEQSDGSDDTDKIIRFSYADTSTYPGEDWPGIDYIWTNPETGRRELKDVVYPLELVKLLFRVKNKYKSDINVTCIDHDEAYEFVGNNETINENMVLPKTPIINSIYPTSGTVGTAIDITGVDFQNGLTLTIGGITAENIILTGSTNISCNAPSYTSGETVEIKVTNPNNITPSVTSFIYNHLIQVSKQGNGSITPDGDGGIIQVTPGANQSFVITANTGYDISDITLNSESIGAVSNFEITSVNQDYSLNAVFKAKEYIIIANSEEYGIIEPSGTQSISYGQSLTYTFTPDHYYKIENIIVDNVSLGPLTSYTFSSVTTAHAITVTFSKIQYTVNAIADNNGSISPSGLITVDAGGSYTFSIAANEHYEISDVTLDGISVGNNAIYNISPIEKNYTINTTFKPKKYSIFASSSGNGSISPSGTITVTYGDSQTFSISADQYYNISDVVVNGISEGAIASYELTSIGMNYNINVSFIEKDKYTINSSADENGIITPIGSISLHEDESISFNIVANEHYEISDVTVNGISQGITDVYTIESISMDYSINVKFSRIQRTIEAIAGNNGSISPAGTIPIGDGYSQRYEILPDTGYGIKDVKINGQSQGVISSYIFESVNADNTIEAEFVKQYIISSTSNGYGSITPSGNIIVNEGDYKKFLIVTGNEYLLEEFKVNGSLTTLTETVNGMYPYTLGPITEDYTITVSFKAAPDSQIITLVAQDTIIAENQSLTVIVTYDVSDNNNALKELGIRIHFDSSILRFERSNEVFTYRINRSIEEQTERIDQSDGNDNTDKVLILSYLDSSSQWPGTDLPKNLAKIGFTILDRGSTILNVTQSGGDPNYGFKATGIMTPEITNIEPDIASANDDNVIIVKGNGFTEASTVKIGNVDATDVEFISNNKIKCILPQGASPGLCGISLTTSDGLTAIKEDSFRVLLDKYVVNARSELHGNIEPSGYFSIDKNTSKSFFMYPDEGYIVDNVYVNGIAKGSLEEINFPSISENLSITVTFKQHVQYTITVTSGDNGTIAPSNNIVVREGENKSFTITPDSGYLIEELWINGKKYFPTNTYTFTNISSNKSISVTFSEISEPDVKFTSDKNQGAVPLKVSFNDNTASEATITSWYWNFGDGNVSIEQDPSHTYIESGNFPVILSVVVANKTYTSTNDFHINVSELARDFSAEPKEGMYPLDVSFLVDVGDYQGNYLWSFGDGITSTVMNPDHTYIEAGSYTVLLYLDDETITKEELINVSGRTISGRIVGEDDENTGLAQYWIEIFFNDDIYINGTFSDESGYYTLNNLPPSSNLILSVWPPSGSKEYLPEFYNNKDNWDMADTVSTLAGDKTINFILSKPKDIGFSGIVKKDDIGISGIIVEAFSESAAFGLTAITDNDGYYTMTGLKEASDYRVYILDENSGMQIFFAIADELIPGITKTNYSVYSWDQATEISPQTPVLNNIDIIMEETGSISGSVKDVTGNPLAGIWVNAWSDILNNGNGVLTDDNGDYTIEYLISKHSDGKSVTYTVEISSNYYPDQKFDQPLAVGASGIDFSLSLSSNITGIVKNMTDIPVSNITVAAWSESTGQGEETITDENGAYKLNLVPADDYIVALYSNYYADQYYNGKTNVENADHINLLEGDKVINFIITKGNTMQGVINGIDSSLCSKAWVSIWSDSTNTGDYVQAYLVQIDVNTQNCEYEAVGLLSDVNDYIISAWIEGYPPAFYSSTGTVTNWDSAEGVSVGFNRNLNIIQGYTISGVLKDKETQAPIPDAEIDAFDEDKGGFGITTTDESGVYTISGLPNGTYNVTAKAVEYQISQIIVNINNDNITNADFNLIKSIKTITGKITNLDIGKKVWINAWSIIESYNKIIELIGNGTEVSYTINELKPAEDYRVLLYSDSYPNQIYNDASDWQNATLINLSSESVNTASNINFSLPLTREISGTIKFPDGSKPGEFVYVHAFSKFKRSGGSTLVLLGDNLNVNYVIQGLDVASDFIVSIFSEKYKPLFYNNVSVDSQASMIDTTVNSQSGIDFILSNGRFIEGEVKDSSGMPVNNVFVEAFSDSTGTGSGAFTNEEGKYKIDGLANSGDYIIRVIKQNTSPFYYKNVGGTISTVRKREFASTVSTINSDRTDINITIITGNSISGTIRNSKGLALKFIKVEAWSAINQTGYATFTKYDGTYKIEGLPEGNDYKVSVNPGYSSVYKSQFRINISCPATNIDFTLSQGNKIYGTVKNTNQTPISGVYVEVQSLINDDYGFSVTGNSGQYTISGLDINNYSNFIITANPPINANVTPFISKLSISADTKYDIILSAGYSISGKVTSDNIGIGGVIVSAFSNSNHFQNFVETDSSGNYSIPNVPYANDYMIEVLPDNYSDQKKTGQSPGSDINFELEPGGIISGYIKDSSGSPFEGATIIVESATANIIKIIQSDNKGFYSIKGLKIYKNNVIIDDYLVSVEAEGYPPQSFPGQKAGNTVNCTLKRGDNNKLIFIFNDSNDEVPADGVKLLVKLYIDQASGGLKQRKTITADITSETNGQCEFTGLEANKKYQVKVKVLSGNLQGQNIWVSNDPGGVSQRSSAKSCKPGSETEIIFKFSDSW